MQLPRTLTHTHAHTLAPACGWSAPADGWLIDWGGPLVISVANDLLNNSLGLFEQMEKAKHEHRRVLTLAHALVYIYFLFPYAFIQMSAAPSLPSTPPHLRRRHLGCFTSAPPLFPDSAVQPCTLSLHRKKLPETLYLLPSSRHCSRCSPDGYLRY